MRTDPGHNAKKASFMMSQESTENKEKDRVSEEVREGEDIR